MRSGRSGLTRRATSLSHRPPRTAHVRSPWFPLPARCGSRPSPRERQGGRRSLGGRSRSRSSGRIEPDAVVADLEPEHAFAVRQDELRLGRLRVLRDVLQGLEAREVHGRLHVLAVAFDAVTTDPDRHRRSPDLRFERSDQTLVGQQRRVDPAGELAEVLERVACVGLDVLEHRRRAVLDPGAASCCASRTFTLSATSCCCAPSCRFRSSRRRSSSCAATRRCRDALSSSISRTLRRTRPACDARSLTNLRRAGSSGSFGGCRDRERAEQLAVVPNLDDEVFGDLRQRVSRRGDRPGRIPSGWWRPAAALRPPATTPWPWWHPWRRRGSGPSAAGRRRSRRSPPCARRSPRAPRRTSPADRTTSRSASERAARRTGLKVTTRSRMPTRSRETVPTVASAITPGTAPSARRRPA